MPSGARKYGAGEDDEVIAIFLRERLTQLLESVPGVLQLESTTAIARRRNDDEADVTAEHRFLMAGGSADVGPVGGDHFLQAGLLHRRAAFVHGANGALRDVHADDPEATGSHAREHAGSQLAQSDDRKVRNHSHILKLRISRLERSIQVAPRAALHSVASNSGPTAGARPTRAACVSTQDIRESLIEARPHSKCASGSYG